MESTSMDCGIECLHDLMLPSRDHPTIWEQVCLTIYSHLIIYWKVMIRCTCKHWDRFTEPNRVICTHMNVFRDFDNSNPGQLYLLGKWLAERSMMEKIYHFFRNMSLSQRPMVIQLHYIHRSTHNVLHTFLSAVLKRPPGETEAGGRAALKALHDYTCGCSESTLGPRPENAREYRHEGQMLPLSGCIFTGKQWYMHQIESGYWVEKLPPPVYTYKPQLHLMNIRACMFIEAIYTNQLQIALRMIEERKVEFNKNYFDTKMFQMVSCCGLTWQHKEIWEQLNTKKTIAAKYKLEGLIAGDRQSAVRATFLSMRNIKVDIHRLYLAAIMSGSLEMMRMCLTKYNPMASDEYMDQLDLAVLNYCCKVHDGTVSWYRFPGQRAPSCHVVSHLQNLCELPRKIKIRPFEAYDKIEFNKLHYDVYMAISDMDISISDEFLIQYHI